MMNQIYPKLVLEALGHVKYPGNGKDIVSLNMVEDDIRIDGRKVSFSLVFEKSNDPFRKSLVKAAEAAIKTYIAQDVAIEGNIAIKIKEQPKKKERTVLPHVKNIIAVASGKGGVGKSTIASNLAVALAKAGYKTGLFDADLYGPSAPKMFGVEDEKPLAIEVNGMQGIAPIEKYGVSILSIGFLVDPENALVWRGAMATSAIKQLITEGHWGELDYFIMDLPPGTSDIHLTLVQTVPITGAVIVSTPQDVALADAKKGINMFLNANIKVPVLGLVENMAWFTPEELPDNKYYLFGKDGCKRLAEEMKIPLLAQIPIVQSVREGGDDGKPAALDETSVMGKVFAELASRVVEETEKRNRDMEPTQKVEMKS